MRAGNICIVGNIASGKSTLTQLLASAIPDSIAIPEDFEENPFLPLFVADPPRWAFTNAVRYFYDYARLYRERTEGHSARHAFIDAGGATNRYIYGRYLVERGVVTPEEHSFYQLLCGIIERAYAYPEPDAYIVIHASPERCFERMQQRGWKYQTRHLDLGYLVTVDQYLARFQSHLQSEQLPFLQVDGDALSFVSAEGRAAVLAQVEHFLSPVKH